MDDRPPERTEPHAGEEPAKQVTIELSAFRQVLRNRDFMALFVAQSISGMGDWVIVGILLDVVNRTGGELGLAIMLIFRFLPAFLFGLLAGAVVDRLERKTLMVACDAARALLVVGLAFANSLAMICVLVFCIETFSLLHEPAQDSAIPDLVKPEELMTANSMMSTSNYLNMAIGTMVATVMLAIATAVHKFPLVSSITDLQTFQHQFAFLVNALTFVASGLLIFTIPFPRKYAGRMPKFEARQFWDDFKGGLSYMWTNPLTRSILGVLIIGFIGGGSLYVLGAPFAQQVLHSVGSKFTMILTFLLVGVVAGAAAAPWISRYFPVSKWFGRAVVAFGLTMLVFTFIDFYALSLVVIAAGGFILGYLVVTAYTLLHQNLDEDVRGRVFAAFQTIMRTALLVSMMLFAAIGWLSGKLIPWTKDNPVSRELNLGFFHKAFYPSMLALIVGAAIVILGGIWATKSLSRYFKTIEAAAAAGRALPAKGGAGAEAAGAAAPGEEEAAHPAGAVEALAAGAAAPGEEDDGDEGDKVT